jgi:hypothetical protein
VKAGRGRPLRFLAGFLLVWVGVRVALLWPHIHSAADVFRAVVPVPVAAITEKSSVAVAGPAAGDSVRRWHRAAVARPHGRVALRTPDPTRVALALLGLVRYGDPQPVTQAAPLVPGLPHPPREPPPPHARSRWSGSAWLLARGGAGLAPGGLGGQLGGSQAGVRLAYAIDRKRRVAVAGRVSSPLGPGLREAALGVEWQPTRLPLRLVAEQRFAIAGGRSGPALAVVGGLDPTPLPLGFRLEGYGQAGVIRRTATEAYVDGALRVAHPLADIGRVRLDFGAGLWGAAQRGAARLDLGPSLAFVIPIGERSVRLGLDWRQRVAGAARPGSGLAVTLGSDF